MTFSGSVKQDREEVQYLDIELIRARIREKKDDYSRYNFSETESNALKTFFDLAQEYDTLHNLYRVCVSIPQEFFELESRLYLTDGKELNLVCTSRNDLNFSPDEKNPMARPGDDAYEADGSYLIPIKGNRLLVEKLPFYTKGEIIGLLEVLPLDKLTQSNKFFLQKYANRIGYNLHEKLIWQQNIEHIKFINNLAADIEHNVVTPNIFYKLFFKKLHLKLTQCQAVGQELQGVLVPFSGEGHEHVTNLTQTLSELLREIEQDYEQIYKHYENTSLFLETLFRRGHFERGQWVLRRTRVNVVRDVIEPQLERYRKRLSDKGITIENKITKPGHDEEIFLNVDEGLIAQVYANLISNAEKYSQEMTSPEGQKSKQLVFSQEKIDHDGKVWVKFNVFTTGAHLSARDALRAFDEGYRGNNSAAGPGTGHGLYFIKNVIEVHGGYVGYEPVAQGNNFYFVLPCQ